MKGRRSQSLFPIGVTFGDLHTLNNKLKKFFSHFIFLYQLFCFIFAPQQFQPLVTIKGQRHRIVDPK